MQRVPIGRCRFVGTTEKGAETEYEMHYVSFTTNSLQLHTSAVQEI